MVRFDSHKLLASLPPPPPPGPGETGRNRPNRKFRVQTTAFISVTLRLPQLDGNVSIRALPLAHGRSVRRVRRVSRRRECPLPVTGEPAPGARGLTENKSSLRIYFSLAASLRSSHSLLPSFSPLTFLYPKFSLIPTDGRATYHSRSHEFSPRCN